MRPRGRARTPFEVLDLPPDATAEEIQDAYLLLVSTYGENSYATYTVLSDRERKKILQQVEKAYQTLKHLRRTSDASQAEEEEAAAEVEPPALQSPVQPPPRRGRRWAWLSSLLAFLRVERSPDPNGHPLGSEVTRQLAGSYRLSAGQYLKNVRTHKGLSLDAIARSTRISVQHLQALEEDDLEELPSGSYRRMMLSSYARTLGLSSEALLQDLPEQRA